MNNLPDDRTRLLAETFAGDWAGGPAAAMARRAAAHARRRRAVKVAALPIAAAAAIAAILFLSPHAAAPRRTVLPPAPASASVLKAQPAGYEIISDDELVATLRDRPLLVLPQENGTKKFVLLDH